MINYRDRVEAEGFNRHNRLYTDEFEARGGVDRGDLDLLSTARWSSYTKLAKRYNGLFDRYIQVRKDIASCDRNIRANKSKIAKLNDDLGKNANFISRNTPFASKETTEKKKSISRSYRMFKRDTS